MIVELALLALALLLWAVYRDSKPGNMPPGPPEIPFYGNLSINHVRELNELRNKYGNIYTTRYGCARTVTICDYKAAKEAMASNVFGDRPHFLKSIISIDADEPGGILYANGLQWSHDRRFILRNMRDLGMGKTYLEKAVQMETQALVDNLKSLNCKPTTFPKSMRLAVLNVVWQLLASKRYELDSTEVEEVMEALEGLRSTSKMVYYDALFPIIKYMPAFIRDHILDSKTMANLKNEEKKVTMKHVEEHKKTLDVDNPRDLIDDFLVALQSDENSGNLTYGGLIQNIVDLFSAGSDTMTNMLRFVILIMVLHPDKKRKCQEEIDRVVGKDNLVSVTDRKNLPYVEAYVMELLRFSSLAYIGVPREATMDTVIMGYSIPKGTCLFADAYFIHHDPEFWDSPEEFRPERFIDEDGKFQPKLGRNFAFGSGKRQCVGEPLARMEMYLFTSALLQNFDIELPPGKVLGTSLQENVVFRVRAPVDQEFIFKPRD